jgi:RNA polymerase sigma-70 factor, ECF subfamily
MENQMLQFYLSLIVEESSKSKFEQLYLNNRQTMLWVAMGILGDQNLAEDAVHEAFLRILSQMEKFSLENCNKTRSYFVLIVRNIAIDLFRKRKQLAEYDLEDFDDFLLDTQPNPEEAWLEKEGSQKIFANLGKLRQSYADVLSLHISLELSSQEIAELLGITPESARVRLLRGRRKLAKYLEDDQNGD